MERRYFAGPPRLETTFEVYGFRYGDTPPASTPTPNGLALNTAAALTGPAPLPVSVAATASQ